MSSPAKRHVELPIKVKVLNVALDNVISGRTNRSDGGGIQVNT